MAPGSVATGAGLKRLLGQTVCFSGKFGWGVQDRLQKLAEAQQGIVVDDLDAAVNLLVLPDLNSGKTVQKKAASLNAKGASIQVIDADAFEKRVTPDAAEITALLHSGELAREILAKIFPDALVHVRRASVQPLFTIVGEDFSNHYLLGFRFSQIGLVDCRLDGAKLARAVFGLVERCSLNGSDASGATLGTIEKSSFVRAKLAGASFYGKLDEVDFAGAQANEARFSSHRGTTAANGLKFAGASLSKAVFHGINASCASFERADLSDAQIISCALPSSNFRSANLTGASLVGCDLKKSDLSGADLSRANLAGADLSDAKLSGSNVTDANLRGTILTNVDLSAVTGYDPDAAQGGMVGPALTKLDEVTQNARRIQIRFHLDGAGVMARLDSSGLRYGWGLHLTGVPALLGRGHFRGRREMSDALLEAARVIGNVSVRFETIEVNTTKSPMKANELRQVVVDAVAEAFKQQPPAKEKLAELTKAWREQQREADAVNRERREAAKRLQEQQEAERKKEIERTVRKAVGKVTDIATFLKALELRADKQKIDKATKMLKASGFQLFNDITAEHLAGVVKSQSDPDLVYACRIDHEGKYACCTQNLNVCGGLRGSICKHLLVLIIGLVKAGELDPATIDGWVAKSNDTKPELDKESMGEIFIRYKGAEAGEVDWRPTETVPEDYYAL